MEWQQLCGGLGGGLVEVRDLPIMGEERDLRSIKDSDKESTLQRRQIL